MSSVSGLQIKINIVSTLFTLLFCTFRCTERKHHKLLDTILAYSSVSFYLEPRDRLYILRKNKKTVKYVYIEELLLYVYFACLHVKYMWQVFIFHTYFNITEFDELMLMEVFVTVLRQ